MADLTKIRLSGTTEEWASRLNNNFTEIETRKVDNELKTGSATDYKVLSDNNLTDELKTKIENTVGKKDPDSFLGTGEVFNAYSDDMSPNFATGSYSHAEGYNNNVSGDDGSHAEGGNNTVTGSSSHAEGNLNEIIGSYAHAEGSENQIIGNFAHVEGYKNTVYGDYSHVGGDNSSNNEYSESSFVHGKGLTATNVSQAIFGQYNNEFYNNIFEVGNGSGKDNKSNAFEVRFDGTAYLDNDKKIVIEDDLLGYLPNTTKYGKTIGLTYTSNTGVLNLTLKDQDGVTLSTGSVDLPLELLIESGSVKTCTENNVPVQGYVVGDKYIDLVLANQQHIYVLVSDLVDQVTITETGSGNAVTDISINGSVITETKGKTFVETSRKVNNKALSSDIILSASDVGALPTGTNLDNVADGVVRKLNDKLVATNIIAGTNVSVSTNGNNVTINATAPVATELSFTADDSRWGALTNGVYTLTITATDGKRPIACYNSNGFQVMASLGYTTTTILIVSDTKFAGKVIAI